MKLYNRLPNNMLLYLVGFVTTVWKCFLRQISLIMKFHKALHKQSTGFVWNKCFFIYNIKVYINILWNAYRRKKKCIRYKECGDDGTASEDNLGSVDSMGDSHASPDCDGESYQQSSGSSPGGLSGLSSLTSPGLLASPVGSLASPSVSLASPSLQSPLTPLDHYDTKPPLPLPRNPVGTNPHDINNPLSVNQLTGKCIKTSSPPPSHHPGAGKEARTVISVP